MKFDDFVEINPRVQMNKGDEYLFVEMADIIPGNKFVNASQVRELKGGSRFEPGDTLFARITPCLENGKIAQIKGSPGNKYFGSTEFIIFRAKDGISDSDFIFYLSLSELIRGPAKKSMSGASGRQRAHIDTIKQIDIPNILLEEQKKIASILSAYDDLIENNTRRIQTLEEMAQRIYREWFVGFRFPGHEKVKFVNSEMGKIPKGWEVVVVDDIVRRIPSGKKYDQKTVKKIGAIPVLDQGRSGIIGYHNDSPGVIASEEDPVIVFANHTCYQSIIQHPFSAIQNVLPFIPNPDRERNIYWLHWATKDLIRFCDYKGHWPEFMGKKLLLPPIKKCLSFGKIIKPIVKICYKLKQVNNNLHQSRDILLPKLISGEIDVSEMDIVIKDYENDV